jgi:AcrR family transcriptional regulator
MDDMSGQTNPTDTTPDARPRRPGRPRSAQAERAILDAALVELLESGYDAMTIEGVAARAGVGKTTIYRRWSSREELVAAALRTLNADVEIPDTGRLRDDLIALMREFQRVSFTTVIGPMLTRLIGTVISNPGLLAIFRDTVFAGRRDAFIVVLRRAQERGELPPEVDPAFVVPMIAGPIIFRAVFGDFDAIADPGLPEQIVDMLLHGLTLDRR